MGTKKEGEKWRECKSWMLNDHFPSQETGVTIQKEKINVAGNKTKIYLCFVNHVRILKANTCDVQCTNKVYTQMRVCVFGHTHLNQPLCEPLRTTTPQQLISTNRKASLSPNYQCAISALMKCLQEATPSGFIVSLHVS